MRVILIAAEVLAAVTTELCRGYDPIQISLNEGFDVGMDVGSPVDFTYKLPFQFTGKIEKVTIDLK